MSAKAGPIVAAIDGHGVGVVETAAMLARITSVDVVAATAYKYELAALSPEPLAVENEARYEAADRVITHATEHAPHDVRFAPRVVPAADIVAALLDLAREVDAGALVLGPDHRGHVTAQIAREAPCPVAVAPADPLLVPDRPREIAAAFDGSPAARMAVLAGERVARDAGGRLTVVAVARDDESAAQLADEARAALAPGATGARVEILRSTDAATALRAASERFDLLVCGTRGRGRITAAVLGSTSNHLASDPPCPVLIVPPGMRRDAARPLGVGHRS